MTLASPSLRWRLQLRRFHASYRPRTSVLRRLSSFTSASLGDVASVEGSATRRTVLEVMEERGMVAAMSSRGLRKHLDLAVSPPRSVYLGIDPTAPSLHVGNLLALMGLLHFVLAGHRAVALIGGGTGSIGDPSGRSSERPVLSPSALDHNVSSIRSQILNLLSTGLAYARARSRGTLGVGEEEAERVKVVDNKEWLGQLSLLDFLRTVGKRARVSTMLSRESVATRLASTGISFTEFSYQLLQAYDFSVLGETEGVTVQLGGSDQWGNIIGGIELMRRISSDTEVGPEGEGEREGEGVYGLTMPLLTTSDGTKFGKSMGNAVWLDRRLTPPVDLFQMFLRMSDEDAGSYLRLLTFVPLDEIETILAEHKAAPEQRKAQRLLASEIVSLVHGLGGLDQAELATSILFHPPLISALPLPAIMAAFEESPHLTRLPSAELFGMSLLELVVAVGLASSKTEARHALQGSQLSLNHRRLTPSDGAKPITEEQLVHGKLVLIKRGKTAYKVVEVV